MTPLAAQLIIVSVNEGSCCIVDFYARMKDMGSIFNQSEGCEVDFLYLTGISLNEGYL